MHRLFALALLGAATAVGAQDFPKLKAGLWTTTMTSLGQEPLHDIRRGRQRIQ